MADQKILAVFDFDDTLFRGQSHSYFFSYLEARLPVIKRVLLKIKKRILGASKTDRQQKDLILAAFKGMSREQFETYASGFFTEVVLNRLNETVCAKLNEHREKGHVIVIASGGFEPYLKHINGHFGPDMLICTRLKFEQDIFSGSIDGEESLGQQKAHLLKAAFNTDDINWAASYVYSDHHSDLPLFNMVGNKVAIDFGQNLVWVDETFSLLKTHNKR